MANAMYDAAQMALQEMARMGEGLDAGAPPGAEPLPWRDQVVQYIDDLPDLLTKGPRYKLINQTYGEGAADEYLQQMGEQVWQKRQRRRPMPV